MAKSNTLIRLELFATRNSQVAYEEIERLQKLYQTQYKRGLVSDLFFSSWGEKGDEHYGVVVYHDKQETEVQFLKENVKQTAQN